MLEFYFDLSDRVIFLNMTREDGEASAVSEKERDTGCKTRSMLSAVDSCVVS